MTESCAQNEPLDHDCTVYQGLLLRLSPHRHYYWRICLLAGLTRSKTRLR